jgi:glycosyltransferase involved in cell wall biosynthesis
VTVRIVVLDRRFSHHASHSGYHQLIRRQQERVRVDNLSGWVPSLVPGPALDRIAERTGRPAYTHRSIGFEMAALRRMARAPRAIYHVLYGEDDYHYLARAAPLLRTMGGRLVSSFHQPPDIFDEAVPRHAAARILPRLDAAVVTTRRQADHLSQWMRPERIHRVPLGVDTTFFSPPPRPRDTPPGQLTCITVGVWQRDYVLLEQLVRQSADIGLPLRFVVVSSPEIAGHLDGVPGVDGYSGISDERLRELYRESDLLLLPLVQAAANTSLLEAMACGLPVLATGIGGVAEYVGAAAGRLVEPFRPGLMLEAILELAGDPAVRAEMGRAARWRAVEHDWRRSADLLTEVYSSVGAQR